MEKYEDKEEKKNEKTNERINGKTDFVREKEIKDSLAEEKIPDIRLPEDYRLNLSDFALFLSVMKVKEAHEIVLQIILGEDNLKLSEVKVEQVILNEQGKRAIRLDAWATDGNERQFNTEMQNSISGDDVRKRSRYYQSMLDTPILKSGKETRYRQLPQTIVTFISASNESKSCLHDLDDCREGQYPVACCGVLTTQEDIFKEDLAMYTFTEQCEEVPGLHLNDGTKKIFLNMSSKNGRIELISLLQYMKNTSLDNPEIPLRDKRLERLDNIVDEVKQTEEWETVKMNILDYGIEQGEQRGMERGIEALILDNLEEGISKERILEKLEKRFQLTKEQAIRYLEKYDTQ